MSILFWLSDTVEYVFVDSGNFASLDFAGNITLMTPVTPFMMAPVPRLNSVRCSVSVERTIVLPEDSKTG